MTLVPYRTHGDQVAADLPSLAAALAGEPEELLRDCAMRPCNATPFDSLRAQREAFAQGPQALLA